MTIPPSPPGPLSGRRILVIEDEYFLADDIVQALNALGVRVVGPVGDLDAAANIVDRDIAIDAAIVDINLRSEMVFPLARVLRARKVPFMFTTGYDRSSIEAEFQDVRILDKPLDLPTMARELTRMMTSR